MAIYINTHMNTTPRSRFGFLAAMASVLGAFGIKGKPTPNVIYTAPRQPFGGHSRLRQSNEQRTSKGHGRHHSRVRAPYFQPCWKRDGFKDEASYVAAHKKAREEHAARLATA